MLLCRLPLPLSRFPSSLPQVCKETCPFFNRIPAFTLIAENCTRHSAVYQHLPLPVLAAVLLQCRYGAAAGAAAALSLPPWCCTVAAPSFISSYFNLIAFPLTFIIIFLMKISSLINI
jgi:hypothetical protein